MISDQPTLPCYMVNNLTRNSAEQCKFIMDNNCLEEEAAIDYVDLVYCEFGHELRYVAILLIVLLVIILFLNLSTVADEYLCPSLLAVAKNLRMSDSLAGVTLLAFGNGCPDIFASLAAASSGRPELIVGELLGAGIFCTSIVAGLVFLHSDFKLATRPLLRDAAFYLLAVYMVWYYCWGEKLTFYGCFAFIVIYVIYLSVALSGQAIHSRLRGNYPLAETQGNSGEKNGDHENWFKWREDSFRRKRDSQSSKSEPPSDNSQAPTVKIRCNNNVTSIQINSDCIKQQTSSGMQRLPAACKIVESLQTCKACQCHTNKAFQMDEDKHINRDNPRSRNFKTIDTNQIQPPVSSRPVIKLDSSIDDDDRELTLREWDEFLTRISPIDPVAWTEAGFLGRSMNIIKAPLLFVTILTVPVVDSEKRLNNWNRLLNSLHCITVPMFILSTTKLDDDIELLGVTLKIWLLAPTIVSAFVLMISTRPQQIPRYHPVVAYVGFAMSVLWIYLLANEIISILKTVGIIFSMTDTAIGLGVLAWGNSLGDIVANLSLAEAGYPRMALGASIGAPLLNLLLGFGLAFTVSLSPGEYSPIEYSPTISLLCSTLAIILLSLMFSTLVPAEKSRKPFGYLLIAGYGFYFAIAVCLETKLINF